MAERIFSRTWVCFVLLAAGLAFPMVGCVDAKVDIPDYYRDEDQYARQDDHREDRDRDHYEDRDRKKRRERKLGKSEAYNIAKELVESRGMEADHFKIKDKKIDGVYWILFERERKKYRHREQGRRQKHLAVRVTRGRKGKTHVTLYMDGEQRDFGRRMDDDKVDKKEAYRFAKRMAEKRGASLRNYEIKDKKIDGNYWILFECEDRGRTRSWKDHFAVRVSKRGIATFYK